MVVLLFVFFPFTALRHLSIDGGIGIRELTAAAVDGVMG